MGDLTAHGGVIVLGCFTVLIGGAAGMGDGGGGDQASALSAAAASGAAFCEECHR